MRDTNACGWNCGDTSPDHKHYAVSVRENGKLLGRLTPKGTTNTLTIHAWIMSNERATSVAREINQGGVFTAKVIPF